MLTDQARKHYPLYTRYRTKKNKDLLLIQRLCDPVTQIASQMLVVDLDKQVEQYIDFEYWHSGIEAGDIWKVPAK
jgi:hypothetical protein